MNSKEHEAAKTAVLHKASEANRQYAEGLISFAEWRAFLFTQVYTPEVNAIENIDEQLIDIRIKYDEAKAAIFQSAEVQS